MSKSKSTKQFPYDELHELMKRERKGRKRWVITSTIASILVLLCSPLLFIFTSFSFIEVAAFAVNAAVIVFTLLMIVLLVSEETNRLSDNHQYIHRFLAEFYMKSRIFTEVEIDNINQRANTGRDSGTLRTLLPLLAVPLLSPILINFLILFIDWQTLNTTSFLLSLVLFLFILFFAFFFLLELDRANTDVIILHAISEYQKERKYAQVVEGMTKADEMTLRAIVEAKKKCPYTQANEKRTSAEVSRLIRVHGTPIHQPPSQQSVASTNGVEADVESARRPNDRL